MHTRVWNLSSSDPSALHNAGWHQPLTSYAHLGADTAARNAARVWDLPDGEHDLVVEVDGDHELRVVRVTVTTPNAPKEVTTHMRAGL